MLEEFSATQPMPQNQVVFGNYISYIYGSDSPGREFWPKCGTFLKKVEPSCDWEEIGNIREI